MILELKVKFPMEVPPVPFIHFAVELSYFNTCPSVTLVMFISDKLFILSAVMPVIKPAPFVRSLVFVGIVGLLVIVDVV